MYKRQIYNGSGGVGPTSTAPDNLIPNNIIKVGQGFMIKAKPAGANQNLVIKNSIRTNDNNGRFYNAKIANTNAVSYTHLDVYKRQKLFGMVHNGNGLMMTKELLVLGKL